jgi:hypothetical protein
MSDLDYTEQDWVDNMHEKYGHLFEQNEDGAIIRGLEVGDGWKWVIDRFLEEVQWLRMNRLYISNPDFTNEKALNKAGKMEWIVSPTIQITLEENRVKFFQIKEKFGELRIYLSSCLPHMEMDIEKAIAKAEARAGLTCIKCGCVGNSDGSRIKYTTKGWTALLCDRCLKEKEKV